MIKRYSKAIAAFVTTAVAVLGALAALGVLDADVATAVVTILTATASALGVALAPANKPAQ